MAMMRRGPLDRYPPEWVLRQANAHQVGGSIEFHTGSAVTFYLDGGHVYAAEVGVDIPEDGLEHSPLADEDAARANAVTLLAAVLDVEDGHYFHDPLGHHPARGA